MGMIFFTKKSKTVYLQGFWPKSVYLKCFGNQLKTVYLQGPCSSRPCISRPCCIQKTLASDKDEVTLFKINLMAYLYSLPLLQAVSPCCF